MAGEPLSGAFVEPVTVRLGGVLLLGMLTSRLRGDSVCGTLVGSEALRLEGVVLLETLTSDIDMGEGVRLALLDADASSRRDGDTDL